MSIGALITRGFVDGSIALVITGGYIFGPVVPVGLALDGDLRTHVGIEGELRSRAALTTRLQSYVAATTTMRRIS